MGKFQEILGKIRRNSQQFWKILNKFLIFSRKKIEENTENHLNYFSEFWNNSEENISEINENLWCIEVTEPSEC